MTEEENTKKCLGDFEIVRDLGRGGMGIVYEARQGSLNCKVALKIISLSLGLSSKTVLRFRREAEIAGKLHGRRAIERRREAHVGRFLHWQLVLLTLWLTSCGSPERTTSPEKAEEDATSALHQEPVDFVSREGFVRWTGDSAWIRSRWNGPGPLLFGIAVGAVGTRPGQVVADIGFGGGQHALILASEVGSDGRVYCRDISERAVMNLRARKRDNIDVALSTPSDVRLPPGGVNTILLSDVYHIVHQRQSATRNSFIDSIRASLRPGGVVVVCYVLAGVFNDKERGQEFLRESIRLFEDRGLVRGRAWYFPSPPTQVYAGGEELTPPFVLEFQKP